MEQQNNQQQPQQPPAGGVPGPTGRRLHIAHRRSPSELTPLMSMFSNPGSKLTWPGHCTVLTPSPLPLSDMSESMLFLPHAFHIKYVDADIFVCL